ncbi:MAG: MFS transporter [Hydrogenophilales bacterium CG_4_9_14_3_um_filter_59_35]|nr:MAG: MFS transporter [Hydrogenophilales bacterium CG18_big_fil_WC_8_21_14_2_50_58_12]PIY00987.1 MAG: MFS transporter [Hydrogenophilales bacterium CG_4_10_14_3_um_filter_58_23]PJB07576.1 MAG: MFS transporter [Hydrogenophilales bacterium CG_4_9_14_3_um_filter_59_35]
MFDTFFTFIVVSLARLFLFLYPYGFLSGAILLGLNQPEDAEFKKYLLLIIGGIGLLPGTLYFFIPSASQYLISKDVYMPVSTFLFWMASVFIGLSVVIVWLRYGVQRLEKLKSRLTIRSSLERNRKTDVRQIEKFLPKSLQFDPVPYFNQKKGLFLGLDEQKKPVYIDFPVGTSAPHAQVVGTTGAGKGVSLGVMAAQFLARGETVFFCDPKNDEWAPHVLYHTAKKLGVPFHFVNLNPPNAPQINPFSGASKEEIHELFMAAFSLSERGDASDFYGIADRQVAGRAAAWLAQENGTAASVFAGHMEELADAEKFAGKLRELAQTLSINAKSGQGVDLAQMLESGGVVYFVGSMRNDIVKTIQRLLLVRFIQLAERRDRMAGPLRPVCVVLDEVKYHLSRPALEGLGAARDKGVHLVLAHQSLGDLRDCPKDLDPDAVVDSIVENCRLKLCYRVMNPATAEWLATMSGTVQVDDEARRLQKNVALAETMDTERTIRQSERYYVDTNMLLNLPKSVAVLYGDGLPKFVSIQPIKVAKDVEAVRIHEVAGDKAATSEESIEIDSPAPTKGESLIDV